MRINSTTSAGFSLVEVALSLGILAIGMVGVLSLLPVGLDGARQVHAETVATQIVRGAIGDLSTNGYSLTGYNQITGVQDGARLRTDYFDREGVVTNQPSAYFRLEFIKGSGTPSSSSCRYFPTLSWPAAAPTNSTSVQRRTFVTDVIRNF
jgi:type II secretory pathway pseudopilin PulG